MIDETQKLGMKLGEMIDEMKKLVMAPHFVRLNYEIEELAKLMGEKPSFIAMAIHITLREQEEQESKIEDFASTESRSDSEESE
jgi:hypothetical protein